MNTNANQRGAIAPYHNMSREANREQQRDPLRSGNAQEEQRNGWTAPPNQQRRRDLTTYDPRAIRDMGEKAETII